MSRPLGFAAVRSPLRWMSSSPPASTEPVTEGVDASVAAPAPAAVRRRRRRRLGFMPANVWLHRWVSMVAGIVLLLVVLSGVALIWQPEIHAWLHRDLYR